MVKAAIIFLLILSSNADARVPDFLSGQKKAIVSINVKDKSKRDVAQGTGFVVDREGLVATSCKMISKWLEDVQYDLIVRAGGGKTFPLYRLIAYNPRIDIAIFKINAEGLTAARLPAGNRIAEYIESAVARYKRMVRNIRKVSPDVTFSGKRAVEIPESDRGVPYKPPDTAESHYLSGLTYAGSKRYTEAIDEYRKALRIKPDNLDAYINLGLAYYKVDRYRDAIDAYNQALKLRPGSKSIYNKLGTIYLILGEYQAAIRAFENALSIDDKDPTTHFNLAIADFLKGDRDSAWQKYIALKGLDADLANKLRELIY
ncbi:MAG: hypothetical protein OHK0032_14170 [Thermodesulfovibrionales bacterium]